MSRQITVEWPSFGIGMKMDPHSRWYIQYSTDDGVLDNIHLYDLLQKQDDRLKNIKANNKDTLLKIHQIIVEMLDYLMTGH
jgi:hypothetical protein